MEALEALGIEAHIRRVIRNWLRHRAFQVKLATSQGEYYSHQYAISKGLPQEGILSPLLWLAFFNPLINKVKDARSDFPLGGIEYRELVFADDVANLVFADGPEVLREEAVLNVDILKKVASTLD